MKLLLLLSLFMSQAFALNEACHLELFQIRERSGLPKASDSARSSLVKIAKTLSDEKLINPSDLKVLNNTEDPLWFEYFDRFQKIVIKKKGDLKNLEYAGLDDQGLMIVVKEVDHAQEIKLTLSTKKITAISDLDHPETQVLAITAGEKSYASMNDYYVSQLSKECLSKMHLKKSKNPLLPNDLHSFEDSNECEE